MVQTGDKSESSTGARILRVSPKGTIYVLNDYSAKHHDPKKGPVKKIIDRLTNAGYKFHHETTAQAAERLARGENILEKKEAYVVTGSDKPLEDSGYTDKQGRKIVKRRELDKAVDPHYVLNNSDLPGINICAGADHHAAMEGLDYKITREHKPNRRVIDGKPFSQIYGLKREDIPDEDIGTKIHNIDTFIHPESGTEYVASFTTLHGKKKTPKISLKYHAERGKGTEIEDFLADPKSYHKKKYAKMAA